uniref:SAGA-associated factor 11 N-terminal domain n=1 Tax=virus sp. ctLpa4 TaxID=2825814 RepID=A0A8S5RLE3_9VIRU|nr:MAG TPA: SAGA-associated factor 11 N-terminal domain [virus sp. ctLpa4]
MVQASLYKGLAPCTKSVAEIILKNLFSNIWRLVRK